MKPMPENFETSESIVEYFIKECVTHTLRYFKNECKRKSFFDVDNLLDMHGFQASRCILQRETACIGGSSISRSFSAEPQIGTEQP